MAADEVAMWWSVLACTPGGKDSGQGLTSGTDTGTPPTQHSIPGMDSTPTTDSGRHSAERPEVTDEFVSVPMPADLLLVVDNSGSMSDDQARTVDLMPAMFATFAGAGLDWRLGVTTTDLDGSYRGAQGTLVDRAGARWVEGSSPNPEVLFGELVTVGTIGSATEQGSGAAFLALEPTETQDPDFRRPDASLHVIVISDEPDLTRDSLITDAAFTAWFPTLVDEPGSQSFSAFVDPRFGADYGALAVGLGGVVQNVGAADWSVGLTALEELVMVFDQVLTPSVPPAPATIAVTRTRDGADTELVEGTDWSWDETAGVVRLTEEPVAGDSYRLAYSPE